MLKRALYIFLIGGAILFTGFLLQLHQTLLIQPAVVKERVTEAVRQIIDPNADIEAQAPLPNPPSIIKAIYSTGWSAGSDRKVQYFLDLLKSTELNAIVIDVKDYTGAVSYLTDAPLVKQYNTAEKRIPKINALIKRFHDAGVYVIGRIAVFQDAQLVKARPDLALHSSSTGAVWTDYKKVPWLDTAATDVWDYNIAIAKDALARGFDEINFDYIRFASDGNLKDIVYPFFDTRTLKHKTMGKFFSYVRGQLPTAKLSFDLFGLTTVNKDDLGIGQYLEDAFPYADYIAPMVYPSHYYTGFIGFKNPAEHPYEVIKYSMDHALARLAAAQRLTTNNLQPTTSSIPVSISSSSSSVVSRESSVKFRPWIQDFNLGASYTPEMVRAEIKAVDDSAASDCNGTLAASSSTLSGASPVPCSALVQGWMLWNPSNVYTKAALLPE